MQNQGGYGNWQQQQPNQMMQGQNQGMPQQQPRGTPSGQYGQQGFPGAAPNNMQGNNYQQGYGAPNNIQPRPGMNPQQQQQPGYGMQPRPGMSPQQNMPRGGVAPQNGMPPRPGMSPQQGMPQGGPGSQNNMQPRPAMQHHGSGQQMGAQPPRPGMSPQQGMMPQGGPGPQNNMQPRPGMQPHTGVPHGGPGPQNNMQPRPGMQGPQGSQNNIQPQPGMQGPPGPQNAMQPRPGMQGPPGPQNNMQPRPGMQGPPGPQNNMQPRPGMQGPPGPQNNMQPRPGMQGPPGPQNNMQPRPGMQGPPGPQNNMQPLPGMQGPPGPQNNMQPRPGMQGPPGPHNNMQPRGPQGGQYQQGPPAPHGGMQPRPGMQGAPGPQGGQFQQNMQGPGMQQYPGGPQGPGGQMYQNQARGPNQPQQQQQQGSRRIDPAHMPRPSKKIESDPYYARGSLDGSKRLVPRSTNDFVAIDDGNATPRYMRMTTVQYPASHTLSTLASVPLACIMQPFARPQPGEEEIPLIDLGEAGPSRCQRCRGYLNLFCSFNHSSGKWKCNLCKEDNPITGAYQGNYNSMYGAGAQPELSKGSVDFAVQGAYITRPVQEPISIYAVDVSEGSIRSGLASYYLSTIRRLVQDHLDQTAPLLGGARARLGLITFADAIHFYEFCPSGYKVLIASDISDGFCPLPPSQLCLNIVERGSELLRLIDSLIKQYSHLTAEQTASPSSACATGTAVAAAVAGIKRSGGRVVMCMSEPATVGQGAIDPKSAENPQFYSTDKETSLYVINSSVENGFFGDVAGICCKCQVSVDVFAFGDSYKDLCAWSVLCDRTGGSIVCFPDTGVVSRQRGTAAIAHHARRYSALEAVLKVRASSGIRVVEYLGNGLKRVRGGELDMAMIDEDNTSVVILEHDGSNLDNEKEVYLQCAILYTSPDGQRRVRVHNVVCPVTSQPTEVFRGSDIDAVTNVLTRLAINSAQQGQQLQNIHTVVTSNTVKILSAYRKHCAKNPTGQQLILPEALKLLPLYMLCVLKSPALRKNIDTMKSKQSPLQDVLVRADKRVASINLMNRLCLRNFINYIYPQLYELALDEDLSNITSKAALAPSMLSIKEGPPVLYLVVNGFSSVVMVPGGAEAAMKPFLASTEGGLHFKPGNTPIVDSIRYIIKHESCYQLADVDLGTLRIVMQKSPEHIIFLEKLAEDALQGLKNMPAYDDFLCQIHGAIQTMMRQ